MVWLARLVALAICATAILVPNTRPENPAPPQGNLVLPLLEQNEEQFAYRVVSEALNRSVDSNLQLDGLFLALMAAIAAIYAIILDKIQEYSGVAPSICLGAFIVSLGGVLLSFLVREGPDAGVFVEDFPKQPRLTREVYVARFVRDASYNQRIRVWKSATLVLAMLAAGSAVVYATETRAGGLGVRYDESQRQRVSSISGCEIRPRFEFNRGNTGCL